MKSLITLSALALALTLPAFQDAEPRGESSPVVREAAGERLSMDVSVADLGFLTGTWAGSDGGSDWESVYSSADGGHLVGASKESKKGRVVMTDFEHFYVREGAVRMTPFPFGNRSAEFTLTSFDAEARTAIFENPEHDFPKRFRYHAPSDDRLQIELVGDMGGQPARFEIDFRRVER